MGKKRRWKKKLRPCLGGCIDHRTGKPKKIRTTSSKRICKNCRRRVAMDDLADYEEYEVHL